MHTNAQITSAREKDIFQSKEEREQYLFLLYTKKEGNFSVSQGVEIFSWQLQPVNQLACCASLSCN